MKYVTHNIKYKTKTPGVTYKRVVNFNKVTDLIWNKQIP